jgi:pimeloyl-ACP methyl ester carboxylesterase
MTTAPGWFTAAVEAPVTERTVTVDGCQVAYRQWGERTAPVLLLVHGGWAHSRWWDHIGPLLTDPWQVRAIDLSGHGASGRRERYEWRTWATETLAVASEGGGDRRPVIVAHSMGARVALRAAQRAGASVAGVVLVDAAVVRTPGDAPAPDLRPLRPHRIYATEADALAHFHLQPPQPVALPYVLAHIAQHSVCAIPGGWSWKFDPATELVRREPERDPLGPVEAPVTIVRGEHGRVTPEGVAALEAVLRRPVPVVEIARAYHHVMIDEPLALVEAISGICAPWSSSTRPGAP